IVFGIILMIYINAVIDEFSMLFGHSGAGETSMILMLLNAMFWIIAIWCFVSAALNIITSFREQKLTLDDLGAKIDDLQKLIVERQAVAQAPLQKPIILEQAKVEVEKPAREPIGPEVPPPPP
ncbi:MAG: hypothetical protein QXY98_00855, partial [Thermoplasmata archaeon]